MAHALAPALHVCLLAKAALSGSVREAERIALLHQPSRCQYQLKACNFTRRSDEDVDRYRKLREIHVEGTGVPKPVASFEEASFPGASAISVTAGFVVSVSVHKYCDRVRQV